MYSDGCSADFKRAGLLLFLSSLTTLQFRILWNWFGSSHGKTDECDAGGGYYKRALGGIGLSDGGFYDDAKRIVLQKAGLPAALLRVGDLVNSGKMLQTEVAVRSSRSRASARAIVGGSSKQIIYESKAGARQHLVLRCMALELPS